MENHNHIYEKVSPAISYCSLCGKRKYIGKVKPSPETIAIETLWNESFKLPSKRYRVLFYILYLTGGRISEILTLRKKDLKKDIILGKRVVFVNLFTLKRKGGLYRLLPIVMDNPITKDMVDEIYEYLEDFQEDQYLFKHLNRKLVHKIFRKTITFKVRSYDSNKKELNEDFSFRLYPHYLRHCRLTHLRNNRGYDLLDLINYAGWSDSRPASTYIAADGRGMAKRDIERNKDD